MTPSPPQLRRPKAGSNETDPDIHTRSGGKHGVCADSDRGREARGERRHPSQGGSSYAGSETFTEYRESGSSSGAESANRCGEACRSLGSSCRGEDGSSSSGTEPSRPSTHTPHPSPP